MLSRSRAPNPLHPFGIPVFFAHPSQKIPSSSCVGARKSLLNACASTAFCRLLLTVLIILQCHGLRSQNHMIKATRCFALTRSHSAPNIRIPGLFCSSFAKNPFMLMFGARTMSAKVRASSAFCVHFPRCFNHTFFFFMFFPIHITCYNGR